MPTCNNPWDTNLNVALYVESVLLGVSLEWIPGKSSDARRFWKGKIHEVHKTESKNYVFAMMVYGKSRNVESAKVDFSDNAAILRDTARCLTTENTFQCNVYTIDPKITNHGRQKRHLNMDLNKLDPTKPKVAKVLPKQVDQFVLDWYYFHNAWARENIRPAF